MENHNVEYLKLSDWHLCNDEIVCNVHYVVDIKLKRIWNCSCSFNLKWFMHFWFAWQNKSPYNHRCQAGWPAKSKIFFFSRYSAHGWLKFSVVGSKGVVGESRFTYFLIRHLYIIEKLKHSSTWCSKDLFLKHLYGELCDFDYERRKMKLEKIRPWLFGVVLCMKNEYDDENGDIAFLQFIQRAEAVDMTDKWALVSEVAIQTRW